MSAAVAEAREIHGYLKPLKVQLDRVQAADLNELEPLLAPMMTTVCLVWANCKYYQCSSKIITLMKEINNMLVEMVGVDLLVKIKVLYLFLS